jgi:hypothetical protein
MDIPIIGEPPGARIRKFAEVLGKHLHDKHRNHLNEIMQGAEQFKTYIASTLFELTDPNILLFQEVTRQQFRATTRRQVTAALALAGLKHDMPDIAKSAGHLFDEMQATLMETDLIITEQVEALCLTIEQTATVRAMLIQMRQFHCDTEPRSILSAATEPSKPPQA